MKKLLILLLVISTNLSIAQESVLLRFNYEKGATYKVTYTMSYDVINITSVKMSYNTDLKIKDVKESFNIAEAKINKLNINILEDGDVISYDSSNKDDDELSEKSKMLKTKMEPMLQALVTFKNNNLGELLESIAEPNSVDENFINYTPQIIFPKEAVKVGSTWTKYEEEDSFKNDYIYKVKSITKDKVVLDVSGVVSHETVMVSNGKINGKIDIDRKSGVVIKSIIEMISILDGKELKKKITTTTTRVK